MAAEAPTSTTPTKLKLKLVVDKKRNKVLYAEAKKDFVDFLIYILSLPLSAAAKYLAGAAPPAISKLHKSVELLDDVYMKPPPADDHENQQSGRNHSITVPHLLQHVPVLPRLTPPVDSPLVKKVYFCRSCQRHIQDMPTSSTRPCGGCGSWTYMGSELKYTDSSVRTKEADYVKDLVPYMVADDLSISPLDSTSVLLAVKGCNIVEWPEVEFGSAEALELLKASLHSDAPLTSVFLKPQVDDAVS